MATVVTLPTNQSFFLADTRSGPNKMLLLPAASTMQGRYIAIKDYYGNATQSTLTISPTGLDKLDSLGSSYVLASSFGSVMLISDGIRSWNITGLYESYIYTQSYISTGLTYYFDATTTAPSGSTWTDIQHTNNITLYNSPTITSGTPGYVTFNGLNQYGSYFLLNQGSFTVTTWIRTTTTADSGTYWLKPEIFSEVNPSSPDRDLGLTIGAGYAGAWSGMGPSVDQSNQPNPANAKVNDGVWHEVTMTSSYTNGTRVYVDNSQVGSAMTQTQNPTGNPIYVGGHNGNTTATQSGVFGTAGYYGPSSFGNFDLSILMVYNRELTLQEMNTNYNIFASRFGRSTIFSR
jgi:hypothetical protein